MLARLRAFVNKGNRAESVLIVLGTLTALNLGVLVAGHLTGRPLRVQLENSWALPWRTSADAPASRQAEAATRKSAA